VSVQKVAAASDGQQRLFRPKDKAAGVEIPFALPEARTIELIANVLHSRDYGIYTASLDGRQVARMDLFSPTIVRTPHSLGVQELTAGKHVLRLECVGKAAGSTGDYLGFANLAERKSVYSRPESVDLRTLQKQ